jgi:hypothetical protein
MLSLGAPSAAVITIGAGTGLLTLRRLTISDPLISVLASGTSSDGNSSTVPVTATSFPITTSAGIEPPVNTKMPSEVLGSPSVSASGSWTKNPLPALIPVTMPSTLTGFPANGETLPLP